MTDQDELGLYPDSPGFKEKGGTSELAAQEVSLSREVKMKRIHRAIHFQPGTADQIATRTGIHFLTVRPRCSELFLMGILEKTTERRLNRSKKWAVVYRSVVHPDQAVYKKIDPVKKIGIDRPPG